jgi:hypothetical protein
VISQQSCFGASGAVSNAPGEVNTSAEPLEVTFSLEAQGAVRDHVLLLNAAQKISSAAQAKLYPRGPQRSSVTMGAAR